MAETTDLQRLVVSMEARYASMERELRKAQGVANRQARAIETRFQKMNTSIGASLGRIGGFIAGAFSLRGAQRLLDTSTRISNSLKVAGLSGDELTRVYDRLFESAQKNAAPIEALVDLYSRASLVQKELGISSEELLGFTNNVASALRVSGKSPEESSGALLQLSQALGSGIVRAEEFNSILEGALPIAQAAAAGLEEAGGSVAKLRQLVVDGKVSSTAFFRAFEAGAVTLEDKLAGAELTVSQQFVRLQNVLQDAAGKIDEVAGAGTRAKSGLGAIADGIEALVSNKDQLEEFVLLMERLVGAIVGAKLGRIAGAPGAILGGTLGAFAPEILDQSHIVEDELQFLTEDLERIRAAVDAGLLPPSAFDATEKRIAELRKQVAALKAETSLVPVSSPIGVTGLPVPGSKGGAASTVKPITLGDYPVTGGSKGKSDAEKAADKIAEVRAELAFEAEQLTRTAREQEIYNRLKAAGVSVTSAEGQAIAAAAGALYDQQKALDRNIAAMDALRGAAGDMASTLIDGLRQGQSATEAFGNALDRLADKIIESGLDALVSSLFGQGGTSGTGPLGAIASALFGGARAGGGPVSAGKAYLVGEKGPELMVPRMPGTVIPNAAIAKGGGPIALHYAPQITIQGNADDRAIRAMRDGMLRDIEARLPGMIGKARGNRKLN